MFHDFRTIVLSLLLLVFCAQDSTALNTTDLFDDNIFLEKIIISSKRTETAEGNVVENALVYTGEDINNLPANNLGESLKYIPGVDISVTNQFGQATALTIHGSNSRDVIIMIDGIPFNTQLSGQADPTVIPIGHASRIEIIKGASSSAWGSSLGGVINIITKDVGTSPIPTGSFKSTFAEFSTTKNSLELAGKIKDLGYYLSGSYLETDGIKSRSDVQENKIFSKFSYSLGDISKLTGSFGYSGAEVHDGVNANNRWTSTPYISRYGKLLFEVKEERHQFKIAYKYNDQDVNGDNYSAITGALLSSSVNRNVYHGVDFSGSVNFREKDVFVFGSDFDWHEFKSSNYLQTSKQIGMQAPYANYSLKWKDWDLIPGLRYDNNNKFGSQVSPSLGVIYHLNHINQTMIRGKISRAFNAPPLMWIYNDDASLGVGPNPNLKAERAIVYELGLDTKLYKSLGVKFDLYRMDIKDALGLVLDGGVYKYDNFRKFRRQGAELSLNYKFDDSLSVHAGGAFNDVKNRTTGEMVRNSDIARQSFSFGSIYRSKKGLVLNLHGYYNRWSADPDDANDRKFILDAKITQEIKTAKENIDLSIFLNIYNMTNSKYWSNPTYPLPRRYFEGGFLIKF